MPHRLVDPAVGVSSVVTGVMDDGALEVQRQESCAQEQGQGPATGEPPPHGERSQRIAPEKQGDGGVQRRGWINKFPRHRAIPRADRDRLRMLIRALNRPEVWQRF